MKHFFLENLVLCCAFQHLLCVDSKILTLRAKEDCFRNPNIFFRLGGNFIVSTCDSV